jgi:hypothetical protein
VWPAHKLNIRGIFGVAAGIIAKSLVADDFRKAGDGPLGLKWPRPQSREQWNYTLNQEISPGLAMGWHESPSVDFIL